MMPRIIPFFCLFTLFSFPIFAQTNYTSDRDFTLPYQPYLNNKDCGIFTNITPYDAQQLKALQSKDSIGLYKDLFIKSNAPLLGSYDKVGFTAYPLLGGNAGYDMYAGKSAYDYFGGLHIGGNIGTKFSYGANYISGNIAPSSYNDSLIHNYKVVPGMGYAYGNSSSGYSYQYLDAYASYSLSDILNFQAGKGKQFWGDGYRSLFLSDASNSYPYFKITTRIWHIEYVNLYAVMRDIEAPSGLHKDWTLKYGTFHYLSWNVCKRLNLGLFESVIWKGNEGNNVRSFDPEYLNPIIFYRPIEFSLGSPDNELLGASFKVKAGKYTQFYGQVILDEFVLHDVLSHNGWWGNKQGVQGGFKQFNLFGVKGLSFQAEANYVRPYTYSHGNPQQNYSNFGQPLADPEGANFIEGIGFLTYRHKNMIIEGKAVLTHYGADSAGSDYGHNIFISYDNRMQDYGNYVGQGMSTYLGIVGLRLAYIVSPKMNRKAELGIEERIEKYPSGHTSFPYVYIGYKASIGNLYNDF